jgi:hypothetical protein
VNDVVWRIDDVGAILCREDTRVFEDSRRERRRSISVMGVSLIIRLSSGCCCFYRRMELSIPISA